MIKMNFQIVAEYFDKIENVASRLEMTNILEELFKKVPKNEIKKIVYLIQGQIAPNFEGKEIGFGEKLISSAIVKATGYSRKEVDTLFSKTGDLGTTAEQMIAKKQQGSLFTTPLTVEKVFGNFERMSTREGDGSQELKKKLLAELFNSASATEARYIARIPLSNIRLGIGDPTIMDAFAIMLAKQKDETYLEKTEDEQREIKKELREKIEDAYNVYSDLGEIAEILKEKGLAGLDNVSITPGTPIRPTAAERLPSAKEIIEKLGLCAVEAKYDGFRVMISKDNDKVKIFSRQSEDITDMFPEITAAVKTHLKPKKCFVEGEALAFNDETNEYYPFQITIQRKRKYDIEKKAKEYPLKLFLFDVVFIDGKNMMKEPFKERRKKLEGIVKKGSLIELSEMKLIDDAKTLENFFEEKIGQGLEGIMAKDLDAPYIAGALFVIGVALAYFINPLAYMIAFAFALLLIIYAALLYKVKYIGNFVVALGTAFTFIYGSSVTHEIPLIIILFALSAFFANMSREVTKDFEDKKKDSGFKVTLPMISERVGKIAIVVYHLMAILVAFWAYFMFNLSVAYFVIVLLSTIVFFNSIKLLVKKNYKKSQKYCKKGMILSLLAYISTIFK